jgi:tRNA 2-thiouridine synthesizing protein A
MPNSSSSSSPPTASSPGETDGETEQDEPHSTIDLSGEVCPFTFVRTKLALEALPLGASLRVVVDHEPAVRNIPRSAAEWGQEVLGTSELGAGRWAIDLRRRVR